MKFRRRFLSAVLSIALVMIPLVAQTSAYANSSNTLLQKATACAQELIADRTTEEYLEDDNWTWNSTTKIESIVPMYDYDGNINSYLFRLNTDGIDQGYIVVNVTPEIFGVEAYGGSGTYEADFIVKEQLGRPMNANDKIIHHSMMDFVVEKNKTYYDLASNSAIKMSKNELNKSYKSNIQLQKATTSINDIVPFGTWDGKYTVKGIPGWTPPYTTSYFGEPNNCGPTAGTNYIHYWSHARSDVSTTVRNKLWSGQVYQDFKMYFDYLPVGGSSPYSLMSGLTVYGDSRNASPIGSDVRYHGSIDWAFITNALKSNIPLLLCTTLVPSDSQYGYHIFMVVGYDRDGSKVDLQTVTGWDNRTDNYYHYNNATTLQTAAYARWA